MLSLVADRKRVIVPRQPAGTQQSSTLAAHLQQVREEERKRIARDLHDRLGQILTVLKIDASILVDTVAGGEMPDMKQVTAVECSLDEAIQAMRDVIEDLRPAVLDMLGLAAAVEWQVQRFISQTGIAGSVHIDDAEWHSDQRETALFRALQELLTNVTRHAEAEQVWVTLTCRHEHMRLCVEDDGVGFARDEVDECTSFGLLGIRERIRAWGGTLTIDAGRSGGSRVAVQVPMP